MGISAQGLLGLADKTGRRQQAGQDLNTLRQLYDLRKQSDAEEQQAEVAYQDTLSKVKDQANNLLEGDRVAINKRAKELQDVLRSKIKALGGSKKAFLKNGGISDLADYKDQVLGSEQMQTYKNNKMNMEKILMIKEKGLGHLINNRDHNALIQYQKTGQGKLSYTGLLNEVKVDQTLFEWGKQISPEDVLKSGSNRLAIIANYEADTGEKYAPSPNDRDLKDYIKFKGYGGIGKNTAIINARIKEAKAKKDKLKKPIVSTNVAVGRVIGATGERSYDDMTFDGALGLNEIGHNVIGLTKDNGVAYAPKKGFSLSTSKYRLRGGGKFAQGKERDFAKNYYDIKDLNEDGTLTLDPTMLTGTYDASGIELSGRTPSNKFGISIDMNKNYTPENLVIGYKTIIQGKPHLIVESLDKNNNPDDSNAELYGDAKPTGTPVMLIRMKNHDFEDSDWYQEVPANSDIALNAMGKNFGEDNDLSHLQKEEQDLQPFLDNQIIGARQQAREETIANKAQAKKLQEVDDEIKAISDKAIAQGKKSETINSEYFRLITNQFNHDGANRNLLVQSFYQAYAGGDENKLVNSADGKMFDQAIEEYGLKDVLLDKNVTDEQFINKYYKADLKAHPGNVRTYSFANIFKQIYDKNINPDKQ